MQLCYYAKGCGVSSSKTLKLLRKLNLPDARRHSTYTQEECEITTRGMLLWVQAEEQRVPQADDQHP